MKRSLLLVFAAALVLVLAIAGPAWAHFAPNQAPDVTAFEAPGYWDSTHSQYRYDITWSWSTTAGKPNWCYFYVWKSTVYVPEWGYSKFSAKAAAAGEATATYYSLTYCGQWKVCMSNRTGIDDFVYSAN